MRVQRMPSQLALGCVVVCHRCLRRKAKGLCSEEKMADKAALPPGTMVHVGEVPEGKDQNLHHRL